MPYAAAIPDGERTDWFALELGVELDGQRVDLLPALLEMLDGTGDRCCSSCTAATAASRKRA